MAFVKLDTGLLTSTLWVERDPREVFITALLMAEPYELEHPAPALHVRSLEETGFIVPPGWYGFVRAAGVGIIRMSMLDPEEGLIALERLSSPDQESRSHAFEGRRMVRVDGGYIILNFMTYRDRDQTVGERMKRYRERIRTGQIPPPRSAATRSNDADTRIAILAEAEAEADKSKDQKQKKPPAAPAALPDPPEWVNADAWEGFVAMRVKQRHPLTPRAAVLIFKELDRLRQRGHDPTAVIDQSTRNAWRDVFEIRPGAIHENRTSGRKLSAVELVEHAIASRGTVTPAGRGAAG